jgi:uncharacterized protein (DUF58 family)
VTPEQLAAEIRRLELATRRLVRDLVAGDFSSAFRGRGVEFADLREYQPGDDVRAIDWRASARLGATQVRIFREERERTVVLVLDASASGAVGSRLRGKRQLGAEIAAVLAFAAGLGNDRVGCALATDRLALWMPPRKGRKQAMRVLEALITAPVPAGHGHLGTALGELAQKLPHASAVVVLSDFLDPGIQDPMARLASEHDVVAVHLVDALEAELPSAGLVTFEDPETGAAVLLDTDDDRVREAVRAAHAAHCAEVSRALEAVGADVLQLDAAQPFETALVEFVRRRTSGRR